MDAIVRNNQDQFVADLTKDDFQILEDGVAQDVTSFTLVHGGRVHNLLAPPPPPTEEGVILPPVAAAERYDRPHLPASSSTTCTSTSATPAASGICSSASPAT